MKKILILSSSAREGGNSDLLAEEFRRGAEETGHTVEKIMLARLDIKGCLGCNFCQKKPGVCVQKDDANEVMRKMVEADVIVFASPVYYFSVNAQLKLLFDRSYSQLTTFRDKSVYFITAGAARKEQYFDHAIAGVLLYASCFENVNVEGVVLGMGATEKGEIKGNPALVEAYEMGKMLK